MKFKKMIYIAAVTMAAMFLCTGCSKERVENQLAYREKGIQYMENQKYDKALEEFQNALDLSLGEIGEEVLDICYYKAEAQYLSGDKEGALNTYSAIINYNQDAKAYFLRGNLYYSLGDETNALKDYAAALENDAKSYELYIGVYEALIAHGKEKDAQEYLNQALEIDGKKAYDKMQKGRINFLLGETDAAISLLKEAAEEKEYIAHYYLAEVYSETGDIANAESSMAAYMESGIADAYNLFNIANTQIGKGNYDMAIECLNAALKLEDVPNKQIVMKTLAVAYEQNLDFASAKKVMADYIKEFPEDEEALREYDFLETR